MGTGEVGLLPEVGGRDNPCLLQEVPGHQVAGCGVGTAEGDAQGSRLPLQVLQRLQLQGSAGDELGVKSSVVLPLGDGHGPRFLQARLYAGQSSKERQLQLVLGEGGHHRRVVHAGNELHRNPQLAGQVLGEGVVAAGQPGGVLVGDAPDL